MKASALLDRLGQASGKVDVPGQDIAQICFDTRGQQGVVLSALMCHYDDVVVLEDKTTHLVLDLWRAKAPKAALISVFGTPVQCTFTYWDKEIRVNKFLVQLAQWAETQLGPLSEQVTAEGTAYWTASDQSCSVTLSRPIAGQEAEARASFTFL